MHDLKAFVHRDLKASLRSQGPLLLMLVVILIGTVSASGFVNGGIKRYADEVQQESALNIVEISPISESNHRPVDNEAQEEIESIDEVDSVHPWFQVDLTVDQSSWPEEELHPGAIWGTPRIPGREIEIVSGEMPENGISPGEIVVPHHVEGGSLESLVGESVVFQFTEVVGPGQGEARDIELDVIATHDNSTPGLDGPAPGYLDFAFLEELQTTSGATETPESYDTAFVYVNDQNNVEKVQGELAERGFGVQSLADRMPGLDGVFRLLASLTWVMLGVLVVLGFVLGSAIGASWAKNRRRDIGLLKAIGWPGSRIARALSVEFVVLGLAVGLIGVLLGSAASLLITAIASGRDTGVSVAAWTMPDPQLLVIGVSVIPICFLVGGLPQAIKAARLDPDVALRGL